MKKVLKIVPFFIFFSKNGFTKTILIKKQNVSKKIQKVAKKIQLAYNQIVVSRKELRYAR